MSPKINRSPSFFFFSFLILLKYKLIFSLLLKNTLFPKRVSFKSWSWNFPTHLVSHAALQWLSTEAHLTIHGESKGCQEKLKSELYIAGNNQNRKKEKKKGMWSQSSKRTGACCRGRKKKEMLINKSELGGHCSQYWWEEALCCVQHQDWALRWSKSAIKRFMWASLLCRYSQRCFSSW